MDEKGSVRYNYYDLHTLAKCPKCSRWTMPSEKGKNETLCRWCGKFFKFRDDLNLIAGIIEKRKLKLCPENCIYSNGRDELLRKGVPILCMPFWLNLPASSKPCVKFESRFNSDGSNRDDEYQLRQHLWSHAEKLKGQFWVVNAWTDWGDELKGLLERLFR